MTEPIRVGDVIGDERLHAKIERLRDLALHRATAESVEHVDDGEDPGLDAARARGIEALKMQRWMRVVPQRFLNAKIDDLAGEIRTEIESWARRPDRRNLVIFGPVGVGKSHAAAAAIRPLVERGADVRFHHVVEMLDLLRPGGPDDALYLLADLDYYVLDDVGSERATDWTAERFFVLVNRRWSEERAIVATTNLAPAELEQTIGSRAFSRLVGSDAVVLQMSGPDRRRRLRSAT